MGAAAYVQPVSVRDALPDRPLFLSSDRYVDVPLEMTYAAAWRGMPQRWRQELDAEEPQRNDVSGLS